MKPLHIAPFNLDEWAKMVDELPIEAEGALLRAARAAWGAEHKGRAPATLPDDDAVLARICDGHAALVAVVRRYFLPDPAAPGVLRWAWLAATYATARQRYETNVERGRKGGRPRKAGGNPKPKPKETPSLLRLNSDESNQNHTPNGDGKPSPVRGGSSEAEAEAAGRGGATAPAPDEPMPDDKALAAWASSSPDIAATIERILDNSTADMPDESRALSRGFLRVAARRRAYRELRGGIPHA